MKLFKRTKIITEWVIDDDTIMPIICDSEERAREIVEKYFNGEYNRIFSMGVKVKEEISFFRKKP